jgi:hypothetical protein
VLALLRSVPWQQCSGRVLLGGRRQVRRHGHNHAEKLPSGVGAKFVFGSDLKHNEVSSVIYEDYLAKALAEGKYMTTPDPHVVGKSLEYIRAAFDVQRKGMSAKKVVASL